MNQTEIFQNMTPAQEMYLQSLWDRIDERDKKIKKLNESVEKMKEVLELMIAEQMQMYRTESKHEFPKSYYKALTAAKL